MLGILAVLREFFVSAGIYGGIEIIEGIAEDYLRHKARIAEDYFESALVGVAQEALSQIE